MVAKDSRGSTYIYKGIGSCFLENNVIRTLVALVRGKLRLTMRLPINFANAYDAKILRPTLVYKCRIYCLTLQGLRSFETNYKIGRHYLYLYTDQSTCCFVGQII